MECIILESKFPDSSLIQNFCCNPYTSENKYCQNNNCTAQVDRLVFKENYIADYDQIFFIESDLHLVDYVFRKLLREKAFTLSTHAP